ncbi:BTAD domain-containing putative transcriptional regulator [Kitasatospora sp. NPDC085895]|uniref:AfsR/SARP family transcriptional regulator n=1 Tax=Kitasatospora sp. NPDC085895 TaxID=3155057 RepID=UPI00344B851B
MYSHNGGRVKTRFGLLGPLAVHRDAQPLPVTGPKVRLLLAALLLRANQPVSVDSLISTLWGDSAPSSATSSLHNHVSRLRRFLGPDVGSRLRAVPPGYAMEVRDGELDLEVFSAKVQQAQSAYRKKDWPVAGGLASQALALWRGRPFDDLPALTGSPEAANLLELYLRAQEWRVEVELHLGHHHDVIAELAVLTQQHPVHEEFHRQLMLALHRAGRQAEALAAYQELRHTLIDELGVEPGQAVREAHQEILSPAAEVTATAAPRRCLNSAEQARSGPNQLPVDTADFTGRADELRVLTDRLEAAASGRGTCVAVISGMAGIGKTALAIAAAHRVRKHFPDGQLFVDLRGFGIGERRDAHGVLAAFITALSHPDSTVAQGHPIPEDTDDRAALLRTILAARRVLLILDNADSAEQVLPLLPGHGQCATVVTSRNTLTDLPGARHIRLEPLDLEEQRRLLSTVCGHDRVNADPDSALRVLAACAGVPLALRIVAARLSARPVWSLSTMAERLAAPGKRLGSLSIGHLNVRDTLASSYLALHGSNDPVEREAARLFRLLGLWPGQTFGIEQASALVERPTAVTADLLELLVDYHLLQNPSPWRYSLHDLLSEYAAERAEQEEAYESRDAARVRLMVWYAAALARSRTIINAGMSRTTVLEDEPSAPLPVFTDGQHASRWCTEEMANIKEAVRQAAHSSRPDLAWRIVHGLAGYDTTYSWTGETDDLKAIALTTAEQHGDLVGQAFMLQRIGISHCMTYRLQEAVHAFQDSLVAAENACHEDLVLTLLQNLAVAYNQLKNSTAALTYARQAIDRSHGALGENGVLLNIMATSHLLTEDFAAAEEGLRRALEIWRTHDNTNNIAITLTDLGDALRGLGRREEALAALREARGLNERLGNRSNLAECLVITGRTYLQFGQREDARGCFQSTVDIAREHHLPAWIQQGIDGLKALDQPEDAP